MTINWAEIETSGEVNGKKTKTLKQIQMINQKFITVAYPYPNSPQHIGHGRTYTLLMFMQDSIE